MKSLVLAGAAILAAALPTGASAQTMPSTDMQTQQQSAYDAWPPERQRAYDVWPVQIQTYFWTLTPQEQAGWWLLNDDQRIRIYEMTPPQRAQAWNAINTQLAATRTGYGEGPSSSTMNTGAIAWVSNPVVQPIAGDQAVYDSPGAVPVCEEDQYDNCMNPWEAGRRGPSVERPLDYWPGKSWNPGDAD